jgi:hypothetical protein
LHLCRGEPADALAWISLSNAQFDAAGFRHFRRTSDQRRSNGTQSTAKPPPVSALHVAASRFAAALTPALQAELAKTLRLPVEALHALPLIGWSADEGCWTLLEHNPAGVIAGITRRFRDGKQMTAAGGKRGLTMPIGWQDKPGPVFIVEGASDTIAMTHAGLNCIGRPSNSGGADMLAAVLLGRSVPRDILVVGENDLKANGDWPGRTGAERVAKALADKTGRAVRLAMPPSEAKDVREWLTSPARDGTKWSERGIELSRLLMSSARRVEPAGGNTPPSPRPAALVPDYRPFPVHALPPVLREFVVGVAESVGCDPAFAALPALTVSGATVGAALVVQAKRGYEQPPLLWLLTVGDSGTGKTPAFKPSEVRAFGIDRGLHDEFKSALRKYKADLETWENADQPDPEAEPVKPVRERFAVIDATIERLTVESTTSPRGLVVVRDEADGWLSSFARYKGKGGGSDLPNWLSMYEAGPVRYMRRSGDPREVEAERAFVAVCGGIQPDILRAALSDSTFIASGLTARIGFAMPPKVIPKWSDRELSAATERAFADVLDALRRLPFNPKNGPGRVNLDATALARFKRLNDEFAEAAEDLDGGPMAAALPKAVRFALRLALVWHCVSEAVAGRDPGRASVGDEAMAAGEELARWFVHEAQRVYAVLAEPQENRSARALSAWVKRKGGRVRPRDLQRSHGTKYPTAESAELALDTLVTTGFGVWVDDRPKEGGGRPSRVFVLHQPSPPESRQNPTSTPFEENTHSASLPDTHAETSKNPDRNVVVSDSVGCRVDASPESQALDGGHARRAGASADDNGVTAGETPGVTEAPDACSRAVWKDDTAFFNLMKQAGAGISFGQVVAYLNERHAAGLPATAGFHEVPTELRVAAAHWLSRLAQDAHRVPTTRTT